MLKRGGIHAYGGYLFFIFKIKMTLHRVSRVVGKTKSKSEVQKFSGGHDVRFMVWISQGCCRHPDGSF
jgi:hypothetical protein